MTALLQTELAGSGRGLSSAEAWGRVELEFELARARSIGSALVRVRPEYRDPMAPERRARVLASLGTMIAALGPRELVVAALREGEIVVLLPGSTIDEAEAFARRMIGDAKKLVPAGETATTRVSLAAGVAATRAGLDLWFEALLAVAGEGADVATACGGETCVHSELYELHQRKVERTKGARAPVTPTAHDASAPRAAVAPSTRPLGAPIVPSATANGLATASGAARANGMPVAPSAMPLGLEPLLARVQDLAPSSAGVDLSGVEAKLMELARATIERALEEQAQRYRGELELYERRIAKMQKALEESELEKEALARTSGRDVGLASVYRDVQGLTGHERDFEQRTGLLRAIAESNLVLREELRRQSA